MRTTQKRQAVLRGELRRALGVRTIRETWPALDAFRDLLRCVNPGKSPLMFGCYANDSWTAYWLDRECRERFVYFTTSEWVHTPLLAAMKVAAQPD